MKGLQLLAGILACCLAGWDPSHLVTWVGFGLIALSFTGRRHRWHPLTWFLVVLDCTILIFRR